MAGCPTRGRACPRIVLRIGSLPVLSVGRLEPPFQLATHRHIAGGVMNRDAPRECRWCGATFAPQSRRGPEQVFCCAAHQRNLWCALRRWAFDRYSAGEVTIAELRVYQAGVVASRKTKKAQTPCMND